MTETLRQALRGAPRGARSVPGFSSTGRAAIGLALVLAAPVGAAAQERAAHAADPPTLRAARAADEIRVDGRLDEPAWRQAPIAEGFRQMEPSQGDPARFPTRVRVLFDERNLYIGAEARDPAGPAGVRVQDLRRDFDYFQNDLFGVSLDPFADGRNATAFQINPHGVLRDLQVFDRVRFDREWDGVWRAWTEVTDSGWTAEIAIPWATLRYPAGSSDWGINFYRIVRRDNESSAWSPWPRGYSAGAYHMGYAGRLTGLRPPPPSTNLRLQPYGVLAAERAVRPASAAAPRLVAEEADPKVGLDAKWAITPSTVLDLTANPDFGQADVDRQVVNLSRFNVFFPERRQFFLESGSLFRPGRLEEIEPFFSRRVGLDASGFPLPINLGARLVRRGAERSAGGLLLHQGGREGYRQSAFAVGRFTQNFGEQNYLGAMLTGRFDEAPDAAARRGAGEDWSANTVGSVDGSYYFNPEVYVRSMLSASHTTGPGEGLGLAGYADLSQEANWGFVYWVQRYVGPGYRAEAGFVRRPDIIHSNPGFRYDWRPSWRPGRVRRFLADGYLDLYHRASDRRFQEARLWLSPAAEFHDGGSVRLNFEPEWQRLDLPFQPLPELRIEPGSYDYLRLRLEARTDPSARWSAAASAATGGFYDGRLHAGTLSARFAASPRAAFGARYEVNALRGIGARERDRTTHLAAPEFRLALDPRLQLTGFYQYNTAAERASANLRLAWEFRPLSYLYVVYNDRAGIDPLTDRLSARLPSERQLIVKLNYLWQL